MVNGDSVDLVDEDDRIIGQALRSECHGDPKLIHRAVHVLLFNDQQQLLLQKRSCHKDIQPGKWDTSVGGHLDPGENYRAAAIREMNEELGVAGIPLRELYHSKIRNRVESENVRTYLTIYNGPIRFAPDEIDEVRFWSHEEISAALKSGCFTPNFEEEWSMFQDWLRRYQAATGERALCAGDSFSDLFRALQGADG
jgi:isopentenyl-diphosphate delta-isomerase type 1